MTLSSQWNTAVAATLLAAGLALTGCGGQIEDAAADEAGTLESGISANYPAGTRLKVFRETALREGPGTAYPIVQRLAVGNIVRVATRERHRERFYEVTHDGKLGWVFGGDLHSTLPVLKWGLHPDASDALRQLEVPYDRIWQTIGSAAASAGTHAKDGDYNGEPFCAAVDINGRGWSDEFKRSFLHRAARLGFAGWWREPGRDGWPSDEIDHFHIIYVGVPMKESLKSQVRDWLEGDNGLYYSRDYTFVNWTDEEKAAIRSLFYRVIPEGDPQDDDKDGVWNGRDNCPTVANGSQLDSDKDGRGDACESDDDDDGLRDEKDNCPKDRNPEQENTDGDARGNACDPDDDNDGDLDENDNCRLEPNPGQLDADGDGRGNACDGDDDNDGTPDTKDNCVNVANEGQVDTDADGRGNACDGDDDNDGVADETDNCRTGANPGQEDADGDGRGDACDGDNDNDGVLDDEDNCPNVRNASQADRDGDSLGNACDPDIDADGIENSADTCPFVYNLDQFDLDRDGMGDACDDDLDNDGIADDEDNCLYDANPGQLDSDGDGIGNVCDRG